MRGGGGWYVGWGGNKDKVTRTLLLGTAVAVVPVSRCSRTRVTLQYPCHAAVVSTRVTLHCRLCHVLVNGVSVPSIFGKGLWMADTLEAFWKEWNTPVRSWWGW